MYSRIFGAFAAVVLLWLHYFPYPKVFGRELPRLGSYVFGVGAITMGEAATWRFAKNEYPSAFYTIPAIVGSVVFAAWGFDHYVELRHQIKDDADAAAWDTDAVTK